MTQTFEFSTEDQARAFWHHLCAQMGLERMMKNCFIEVRAGAYEITVKPDGGTR